MIKTLAGQIKEFKKASILTPVFMILEVLFEMMIPLLMASIIDNGVEKGDIGHICKVGIAMAVLALCGLWAGVMGGKYGARASTGFARNLRRAMYENIQNFSFSNIDKFSTAGLITRLTTMSPTCKWRTRCAAAYVYSCPGKSDLRHGYGVYH